MTTTQVNDTEASKVTITECRTLLGALADGKSDAEVEALRDGLTSVANQMYDGLMQRSAVTQEDIEAGAIELPGFTASSEAQLRKNKIEAIRWAAYMHEHPEEAV